MKIKFNKEKLKEFAPYLLMGSITVGVVGAMAGYYLPDNFRDNVKQASDFDMTMGDIEISEMGDTYLLFDVGEHKVTMSQNDAFHRKIEEVPGYEIIEVEVNGWRDNSKVTFVNKEPVKVKVVVSKDGKLECKGFGVVNDKEKEKSK